MPQSREEDVFQMPTGEGEQVAEYSLEEEVPVKPKKKGIYIPLKEDGSIDGKRFKADAKEKFQSLVSGSDSKESKESVPNFEMDRSQIPLMYDGVAMILQKVGTMFFKWPSDLTRLLVYSEESKRKLTEPTAKVIDKFAPAWLAKNQELVFLGMVFATETKKMVEEAITEYASTHQAEIQAAQAAVAAREAEAKGAVA